MKCSVTKSSMLIENPTSSTLSFRDYHYIIEVSRKRMVVLFSPHNSSAFCFQESFSEN